MNGKVCNDLGSGGLSRRVTFLPKQTSPHRSALISCEPVRILIACIDQLSIDQTHGRAAMQARLLSIID